MLLEPAYGGGGKQKNFSTNPNRELQIKTTMRYHLTPLRMTTLKKQNKRTRAGEDVKKLGLLRTVDGNVNWYSLYGKQYRGSSKN